MQQQPLFVFCGVVALLITLQQPYHAGFSRTRVLACCLRANLSTATLNTCAGLCLCTHTQNNRRPWLASGRHKAAAGQVRSCACLLQMGRGFLYGWRSRLLSMQTRTTCRACTSSRWVCSCLLCHLQSLAIVDTTHSSGDASDHWHRTASFHISLQLPRTLFFFSSLLCSAHEQLVV